VTPLFTAVRWLHEAGLMLVFGSSLLRVLLHARLPALGLPPGRVRRIAALLALLSAPLWLGLTTAQMAGDNAAMFDPKILMLTVSQTQFGQIFLARAALLVLLGLGALLTWRDSALAFLSGAALVLISVTSHAAEASPAHFAAIGITSDGLHLLTGGFWIGGLALLAALFVGKTEKPLLAGATAIFAEWGVIAVAILVLTGMLNAATILLGGDGHDMTGYLAVLGAKLALVAAMVVLALVNHFRLLPLLKEDGLAAGGSVNALLRNIRRELGLGLVVVALAALLGLLAPTM
jgi:putative copper resistance protein D